MRPESPLVLAIDIGTSYIRAAVVDHCGTLLSYARQAQVLITDDSGKAEHDPECLFRVTCEVSRQVSMEYRDRIDTVSVSAYQLGMLAVDRSYNPLTGIITLLDTRARTTHHQLCERIDMRRIYEVTGCPPLYHYPLAKIDWLRSTDPHTFKQAKLFLGVKDYLVFRLLGRPFTEPSTACATQMLNVKSLEWDPAAIDAVGLDTTNLPDLVPSDKVIGQISNASCDLLGVRIGTSLVPGVYDGGAVALGLGVFEADSVVNFGTTAMLRTARRRPTVDAGPSMALQTYYLAQDTWLPGAAINNAGVVLSWLRDNLLGGTYEELTEEAASVKNSAGLVMLPFLSGERNPEIGSLASGVFSGLRANHHRGHILRAALEGVVFALCLVRDALLRNNIPLGTVRVGGGAARSSLWMTMLSTAFDTNVQVSCSSEPGLLGAAMVGHTAAGRYSSVREASCAMTEAGELYQPDPKLAEEMSAQYEVFKDLVDLLGTSK